MNRRSLLPDWLTEFNESWFFLVEMQMLLCGEASMGERWGL